MIATFRKSDLTEKISKHLTTKEFSCQCNSQCDLNFINTNLVGAFEAVRADMGSPVKVTSGFRCTYHNMSVGGVERSKHTQGMAMDLWHSDRNKLLESCRKHFSYVEEGKTGSYVHCHITLP